MSQTEQPPGGPNPAPIHFFSSLRPRQPTGRGTWTGARAALPHLLLDPQEDGSWICLVMRTENGAGAWVGQTFGLGEIPLLLQAWVASPEECIRRVFGVEPPTDLATAGRDRPGPREPIEIAINLEDL
jgi:hypothetical protein